MNLGLTILFTVGKLLALTTITCGAAGNTQHNSTQHHSDYAGEETRKIKSLSNDDMEQLNQGQGWGMAKVAELNGMPGPVHLLQLKNEIKLTAGQISQLETLFTHMKQQAIPLGKKLINLEAMLNNEFANRTVNNKSLKKIVDEIASTRSKLRFTHLATHLKTPDVLTPLQIQRYNTLRGYNTSTPSKQF